MMENLIRLSYCKARVSLLHRLGVRRSQCGKIPAKSLCNGRYASLLSGTARPDLQDVRTEHRWFCSNSKRFLQPANFGGGFVSPVPCSHYIGSSRSYCSSSENEDKEKVNQDKDDQLQSIKKIKKFVDLVHHKQENKSFVVSILTYIDRKFLLRLLDILSHKISNDVPLSKQEKVVLSSLKQMMEDGMKMKTQYISDELFEEVKNDESADIPVPKAYKVHLVMMLASLILFAYIVSFVYLYKMFPENDSLTAPGTSNQVMGYVTLQEFFDHLLFAGQVQKIVVEDIQMFPAGDGNVATVYLIQDAIVKGKRIQNGVFRVPLSDKASFEQTVRNKETELGILMQDGVEIVYSKRDDSFLLGLTVALVALATLAFIRLMPKSSMVNPIDKLREPKFVRADKNLENQKKVTFKDVAGLQEAKIEIMEFVDFLKNPEKYKKLGGSMPRGALLLGPPGCGKTLLAKAVASEAGVAFFAMGGSQFVEVVGGLGASRVRKLFQDAKENSPCVVFIDEIDALGNKRGNNFSSGEEEHTLVQLLVELDGMTTDKNIICLAATNRADNLDSALLRPGRFSRHITIGLPTQIDRKEIFHVHLKNLKKLDDNLDDLAEWLSKLSHGMSGADIANICNEAALHAAREKQDYISRKNFQHASERVSLGAEKQTSTLSKEERHVVAYHESGHALVSWLLKNTNDLLKVSIVERTGSALGVTQFETKEKFLRNSEELFEEMCVALGGRAAEMVVFKRLTSGAVQDLEYVTQLAYNMVQVFGMNKELGAVSFSAPGEKFQDNFSQHLKAKIDHEVQKLVSEAYRTTEKLLQENEDKLHTLATELLTKETITQPEIVQLIGPPVSNEEKASNSQ